MESANFVSYVQTVFRNMHTRGDSFSRLIIFILFICTVIVSVYLESLIMDQEGENTGGSPNYLNRTDIWENASSFREF